MAAAVRDDSIPAVCPLCGTANAAILYDVSAAETPEDVPGWVARCRSCPMWFKVLVDPDGIPKDYQGESGEDEITQTYLHGEAARTLFRQALRGVAVPDRRARPRLLDIGAGQGVLLEEAAQLGFDAVGIDHSESNVQHARAKGLQMRHGEAEDLDDREAFDVIMMMDIIEHVLDPLRLLANAQRALKAGGELVVYTPNHRAAIVVLARMLHGVGMRQPVREIFGRNHVCFFDDQSLPLALQKTGLDLARMQRFPYDPSRPGQPMSRLNLAAVTLIDWLGTPFNRVLRMLMYARKPAATA